MRNCRCYQNHQKRCYHRNCGCNMCNYNCNCRAQNTNNSNPFPTNYLYGYAYTLNQTLNQTFDPQTGLDNGSMFPELVSPYYPGDSIEFINYLKNTGRNGGCGCDE